MLYNDSVKVGGNKMTLVEMFKLMVEVCGLERTVIGILLVVTFYVVSLITMVLLFKHLLNNVKELVERRAE